MEQNKPDRKTAGCLLCFCVGCLLLSAVAHGTNLWLINHRDVDWVQGRVFGYGLLLEISSSVGLVLAAVFGICWLVVFTGR